MILIVGLGNPGTKYENSRHNLGFMVASALAREFSISNLQFTKKFNAEICQLSSEIILVKPQAFMNASGMAVAKIAQFYKVSSENIWIVHDDVDLPLGKLKVRFGGAAAGHHGVESVIKEVGTDKFVRFRLGIGHPQRGKEVQKYRSKESVEKYVLENFEPGEKPKVKHLIKKTVQALIKASQDGLERAMNEFN